jgi:antitoxin CptB
MSETTEARLKRMTMRSWRRGTKEMDLILGPWAESHLSGLSPERLEIYEGLLAENDHDLMAWILGHTAAPLPIASLLAEIGAFARTRLHKV